jgi:hypothetical protein
MRGLRSKRKVEVFRVSGVGDARSTLQADLVIGAHNLVPVGFVVLGIGSVPRNPRIRWTLRAEERQHFRIKFSLISKRTQLVKRVGRKEVVTY